MKNTIRILIASTLISTALYAAGINDPYNLMEGKENHEIAHVVQLLQPEPVRMTATDAAINFICFTRDVVTGEESIVYMRRLLNHIHNIIHLGSYPLQVLPGDNIVQSYFRRVCIGLHILTS